MPTPKPPTNIKIVSAGRPDADDEDVAWLAAVRAALRPQQQAAFDGGDFVECDACAAKPGMPSLCAGCLANRYLVGTILKALGA